MPRIKAGNQRYLDLPKKESNPARKLNNIATIPAPTHLLTKETEPSNGMSTTGQNTPMRTRNAPVKPNRFTILF